MSSSAETRISIFSLNCWGLKYVSKHRSERIQAITRFLENSCFDIVALQELWVYADYEIIVSRLSTSLPFSKFFYSGALGAGLAIFSRFPIVAATIHPYSLNGSPLDVIAGDWFVGKAAASVLITHPTLGQVQVFNTHLFAKGGEGGPEHHRAHRLVNAWEFAKLAKQAAELGRYVIAHPHDAPDDGHPRPCFPVRRLGGNPPFAFILSLRTDLYLIPSPSQAIEMYGVTADSPLNTYSAGKRLDVHARASRGKRLDYILFRNPAPPLAPAGPLPTLNAVDAHVLLTDPIPGLPFSYSDHFGISATLQIKYPRQWVDITKIDNKLRTAQKQTPPTISALSTHAPVQISARLAAADTSAVLSALTACHSFARARAKRHLHIFELSVGTLVSLIASARWFPPEALPFVMLGGAVATWLGTTMFYVGFVYGRWEVNALMNVIEELELYRKSVEDVATTGELDAIIKP
ncbi:inositol phosphophingolipids phospholipase C [Multifurca ochricompacta]|uniref:Inositol phosphophingolipids phospholipase C n=1 Tax=Multifurca ochricompacta TaxID=376703 RepID=A0AAD4ME21_9AGAM|nr:inositol phosphophingolipids phospholipase C [Multifurca ochricompacta]